MNIAFLAEAWTSFPDNPPYPLLCVVVSQVFYILDALYYEVSSFFFPFLFFFTRLADGVHAVSKLMKVHVLYRLM